jgi:hypothetical protein
MINEDIVEAIGAQPFCERIDAGIIFARVTNEKYGHRPSFLKSTAEKRDQGYAFYPKRKD